MFFNKPKEQPKIIEKISVYPVEDTSDEQGLPLKPSKNNYQRYQALMYAGVAAISLATMIALIGLKPMAYLVLKGRNPLPLTPEISNLTKDCFNSYDACYEFPHFGEKPNPAYETAVNGLAKRSDINPVYLVALAMAIEQSEIPSQKTLEKVADTFVSSRQNTIENTVPPVFISRYGDYRLKDVNYASYLGILTLNTLISDKQTFNDCVLASPHDDTVNNLAEIIETIL